MNVETRGGNLISNGVVFQIGIKHPAGQRFDFCSIQVKYLQTNTTAQARQSLPPSQTLLAGVGSLAIG
jgi:hypothetical protein